MSGLGDPPDSATSLPQSTQAEEFFDASDSYGEETREGLLGKQNVTEGLRAAEKLGYEGMRPETASSGAENQSCVWNYAHKDAFVLVSLITSNKEIKLELSVEGTPRRSLKTITEGIVFKPEWKIYLGSLLREDCEIGSICGTILGKGFRMVSRQFLRFPGVFNNYTIYQSLFLENEYLACPSLHVCFLTYSTWLLERDDYECAIPEMIEQLPDISNSQPTEEQAAYALVEQTIGKKQMSMGLAGCLMAIIGVLRPVVSHHHVSTCEALLLEVSADFLTHLRKCEHKKFETAVLRGMGRCLAWSLLLQGTAWKSVLSLLTQHADYCNICIDVLAKSTTVACTDAQLRDWLNILSVCEERTSVVSKLVSSAKSFGELFQMVAVLHPIYPADGANLATVATALTNIAHRKSIQEKEVSAILDALRDLPGAIKPYFYATGLPEVLVQFLRIVRKGDMALYRRMYVTEYDERLLGKLPKLDLASSLIKVEGVKLGEVVQELKLDVQAAESLYQVWLSNFTSFYGKRHFLQELDDEVKKIQEEEVVAALSRCAVHSLLIELDHRGATILSVVDVIDSLKCPALQQELFTACEAQCKAHPKQLSLWALMMQRKRRTKNSCLLDWLFLCALSAVPFEYEGVEAKLLSSGQIDESWAYCISECARLGKHETIRALLVCLSQFALSICERRMKIAKLLSLKKTPQTRDQLCALVKSALHIQSPQLETAFEEELQVSLEHLEEIADVFMVIESLLATLLRDLAEKDAVREELAEFKRRYVDYSLAELRFPPGLETMRQAIRVLGSFRSSSIIKRFLAPVTLTNVVQNCTSARSAMLEFLMPHLREMLNLPAKSADDIFIQDGNWRDEVKLLEEAKLFEKAKLDVSVLSRFLTFYEKRDVFRRNCKSMVRVCRFFNLPYDYMSHCRVFLNGFSELKLSSAMNVISVMTKVEEELQPAVGHDSGDSALQLLAYFLKDKELMNYVNSLTEERLKYMLECVNDYDEGVLTAQTVRQLEIVWSFWSGIKGQRTIEDIFLSIQDKMKNPKFTGIRAAIETCISGLRDFQELNSNLEQKEEAKRKQIEALYRQSTYVFQLTGEVFQVVASSPGIRNRQIQRFGLEDLSELQDRAQLTIRAAKTEEEKKNIQELCTFVALVHEVRRTLHARNELLTYGYCDCIAESRYECVEGNFEQLSQHKVFAESTLSEWKAVLAAEYLQNHFLTYLSGAQIWKLEKWLRGNADSWQAAHLLTCMGKSYHRLNARTDFGAAARLKTFSSELQHLPAVHMEALEVQYPAPTKARIESYEGRVLFLHIQQQYTLHALLSLYLHTNNGVPRDAQVLLCTNLTTTPEVMAFLYRCFTSPQRGELYTLVGCEHLQLEVQTQAKNLFHQLTSQHCKEHFGLALITSEYDSLLAEYFLESLHCVIVRESQVINSDEDLGSVIRQIDSQHTGSKTSNSVVVVSANAGMGKTQWVRRQALIDRKNIVAFSLSGNLDLEEICTRLLALDYHDLYLHITLNHVDNPQLLNDVLTYLVIFRTLRAGGRVVVLPKTIKIFIEVQNLQPCLKEQLPILRYLTHEVVQFNLQHFELSEDALFVGRYLCLFQRNQLNADPASVDPSREEYLSLYKEYFVRPQKALKQEMSYLAMGIFVRVMKELLRRLELSCFNSSLIQAMIEDLRTAHATELISDYEQLREDIFEGLLKTAEEITTRCVTSMRFAQKSAASGTLCDVRTLSWEQSNHFALFFLRDNSHRAIYRDKSKVPAAFKKLIYIQKNCKVSSNQTMLRNIKNQQYEIEDYSMKTHDQLLKKLQVYAGSSIDLAAADEYSYYVMTPDNFLKMSLIHLRAEMNLPIIIMGETGCGKTSLVKFFVEKVCREKCKVLNIHAGITSVVFAELFGKVLNEAQQVQPTRFWVFFDEFNTSDCVGQISDILCERRFLGRDIPSNVVTVAACNPYRLKPASISDDNIGIKKSRKYRAILQVNLMHMVKPLPETCLEYIWDFGALSANDMHKYVDVMLKRKLSIELVELFTELVCASQLYFRKVEDASSVSLRDVARFMYLYEWLKHSLKLRKGLENKPFLERCQELGFECLVNVNVDRMAAILALCSCYYYRLSQQCHREEYLREMSKVSRDNIKPEEVRLMLKANEDGFLARMELPKGVAYNQAFRENVSCIITCVFAKLPLLICGKPGCSKSLAIQVVLTNFRGEKSKDPHFRTLPELVPVFFQGSESCTSESIVKVFKRAQCCWESKPNMLVPVIIMDEIGLAEVSKHNPLKVLHSHLELENRKCAFIGISNWRLDVSKMNRAMHLARPDPDTEELKLTALSIYKTISQSSCNQLHANVLESMARAYYEYHEQDKNTSHADFFGLRDFYHTAKQIAGDLSRINVTSVRQQLAIVKRAIERNFGGLPGGTAKMHRLFARIHKAESIYETIPDTSSLELIQQNLSTPGSRYLMLICSGEVAAYALGKCLPHGTRQVLVGSRMPADNEGQEYGFKLLSDIILYMEKGTPLVLKDMDYIYSSLYDLFNQNFSIAGGRKYCRVALGAQFNPRCFVHDHFHVTIFMSDDDKKLQEADAPFLNRFEKHCFEVDQLMDAQQKAVFKEAAEWVQRIAQLTSGRSLQIRLGHIFPLYSESYLKLLTLYGKPDDCFIAALDSCKEELLRTATEELLLVVQASTLDSASKEQLLAQWSALHAEPFPAYLQRFHASDSQDKAIAFTYDSSILQSEDLPIAAVLQSFSAFRREQELLDSLTQFYGSAAVLYVLDLHLPDHSEHLSFVKFILERVAREHRQADKKLCLLVRMARNVDPSTEVCSFREWDQRSFSVLAPTEFRVSTELLSMTTASLVERECFEDEAAHWILEVLHKMDLQPGELVAPEEINKYMLLVFQGVSQSIDLVQALKTKILSIMSSTTSWVDEALCDPVLVSRSPNLRTALRRFVEAEILVYYPKIIFAVEQYMALRSFFTKCEAPKLLQHIWLVQFAKLSCDYQLSAVRNSNKIVLSLLLDFPFSYKDYRTIEKLFAKYGTGEDEAKLRFLREFREQTVLQCEEEQLYDQVCAVHSLVDLYLKDLIRISIEARPQLKDLEEFMWQMHCVLAKDDPSLEEKVFALCSNRNFVCAVCEILLVLHAITQNDVSAKVLLALSCPTEQIIDESSHCLRCQHQIVNAISLQLRHLLDSAQMTETSDVQTLAAQFQALEQACQCLCEVYSLEIECLAELQIWKQLTDVLSQSPQGTQVLVQVQQLANSLGSGYLFNLHFTQTLGTLLEANCPPEPTQRFKAAYFVKFFAYQDPQALQMIVEEINRTGSAFWRFSQTLIEIFCKLLTPTTDYPFFEVNDEALTLEALLASASTENRFAVLCSDYLNRHAKEGQLVEGWKTLQKCLREPSGACPWLTKLHSCACIRKYLEEYCRILVEDPKNITSDIAKVMHATDECLSEDTYPVARVYALKHLKQRLRCSTQKLAEWISTHRASWLRGFSLQSQELAPQTFSPQSVFDSAINALNARCQEQMLEALKSVVDSIHNEDDRVAFVSAVCYKVNCELGQPNATLTISLAALKSSLEIRLGTALFRLVTMLATGQLRDSPITVIGLCLIQLLANTSALNLFLDAKGQVHSDLPRRLKSAYVYGVGIPQLYEALFHSYANFAVLKSPPVSPSRVYKCSCGHVYFIGNCGKPVERSECPVCKKEIGGVRYVLVQREGHINFQTDADAFEYLKSQIAQYTASPDRGLCAFLCDCCTLEYRQIRMLSHRVLRLFLFLQMHFLNICGLLSEEALSTLLTPAMDASAIPDFLAHAVEEDYKAVLSCLNEPETTFWWAALARRLPDFMKQHRQWHSTLSERTALEKDFDAFFTQFIESPISVIQEEKVMLKAHEDIQILEEVYPSGFRDAEFYRVTVVPECEDLRQTAARLNLKQYPLVQLFFDMRDRLQRLQALGPVVALSNYLMQQYSHRLRRDEATKPIGELAQLDPDLKELYVAFEVAWNAHLNIPLQYECHLLKPLEVKPSLAVSFFLPDKMQAGGDLYMIAALTTLATIQNEALTRLQEFKGSYLMDTRRYPVQRVQLSQVIAVDEVDWDTCYVNHWAYGYGSEVVVNFEKLQAIVRLVLSKAKFLDADSLTLMQYQFEMLSYAGDNSDLLSAVRKAVPQQPLSEMQAKQLQLELEARDQLRDREQELLKLYDGVERLLCLLKYAKAAPETALGAFVQASPALERCEHLTQHTRFSQLPLKHVVALYELLELQIFPCIRSCVRSEYTSQSAQTAKLVQNLHGPELPPLSKMQQAVLRILTRLLVAGGLDAKRPLAFYITRPDYWEAPEAQVQVFAEKLGDTPLAHTMQVYEILEEEASKRNKSIIQGAKKGGAKKAGTQTLWRNVG